MGVLTDVFVSASAGGWDSSQSNQARILHDRFLDGTVVLKR